MLGQDDKNKWQLPAGILGVVVAPCLVPCLYHVVLGHHQAALFYAVPSFCCGLLYLGFWRVLGSRSALEMGLVALIVCVLCAELTPVVIKLYAERHAGGAVMKGKSHAARVAVANLSGV